MARGERRSHVGPRRGADYHFRQRVHVQAVVVKTVEEATVPGEVIFPAAAERERAVAALGEIRDSWGGRNWKRQSIIGVKFLRQLSGHRLQFVAGVGVAGLSQGE